MKISQLQSLVSVVEQGNFTEAAFALGISQSAVSHAIAGIEEELGVSLLCRSRRGAHATPVGERVMEHARQVLQRLDDIVHEATLEKGLAGGRLRIASFRSAATHLLPSILAQFRCRFPDVAITIAERADCNEVAQALREGRVDLGLTCMPAAEEFEAWEIAHDEFVVLLHNSEAPESRHLTWQEVATYSFILHPNNECAANVLRHCATAGYPLKVVHQVKEDSTIVSMVAQGLGAAVLPRLAAEPLPQGICAYSLPVPLERSIGAAICANSLHVPAVYAFLDALRGVGLFADKRSA